MRMVALFIQRVYSKKGYSFFKSGLYLDYYLKKIGAVIWVQLNTLIGILFLERFIIEFLTKKITEKVFFLYTNLVNTQKKLSHLQFKLLLLTIITLLVVIVVLMVI